MKEKNVRLILSTSLIFLSLFLCFIFYSHSLYAESTVAERVHIDTVNEDRQVLDADRPYLVSDLAVAEADINDPNCTAYFDASTGTITFKNLTAEGIYEGSVKRLNIVLIGENFLNGVDAIRTYGDLAISGVGSLNILNGSIATDGNLFVNSGKISIKRSMALSSTDIIGIWAPVANKEIIIAGNAVIDIDVKSETEGTDVHGIYTNSIKITDNAHLNIRTENPDEYANNKGIYRLANGSITIDTKGSVKIDTIAPELSIQVSSLNEEPIIDKYNYRIDGSHNERSVSYKFVGIGADVTKIGIKVPPKTSYGVGEGLDLTDLVALIYHSDTDLEEVTYEYLSARGIQTSLAQGEILTINDNELVLTHTLSGKSVVQTLDVTIKPLEFTFDEPIIVPEGEFGESVAPIDLSSGVKGGEQSYSYEKEGVWPDWLTIDEESGIITGKRPSLVQTEMQGKIKITDSAGQTIIIDIIIGATHHKPIKLVNQYGDVFYLDKEHPYFNDWGRSENCPNYGYGHYDIYTNTLTFNKLEFAGYFDIVGDINIVIEEGKTYLFDGRIIADGNINISGDGTMELGYTYGKANIRSKAGDININGGNIIVERANDSSINRVISADLGSVVIGGNAELEIEIHTKNGKENSGIYAYNSVDIVDRAYVEIEVRNGSGNTGIGFMHGDLNISTKSKLDIITWYKNGGENRAVYRNHKVNVDEDDYVIVEETESFYPHKSSISYTYKGSPSDVKAIKIGTMPAKTSYFVGEKLDLTGLVLILQKHGGLQDQYVPFSDLSANGITSSVINGKRLKIADTTLVFNHAESGSRGELALAINQAPLTFLYDESLDFPSGEVQTNSPPVDVSDAVFGGSGTYYYELEMPEWVQSWLSISGEGRINGWRYYPRQASSALIRVTDSYGNVVEQRIKVGAITTPHPVMVLGKELNSETPYLVAGEPRATPQGADGYNAYYDTSTATLYLKNCVANTTNNKGISSYSELDLTIDITGYNELNGPIETLSLVGNGGIIRIKGTGTLKINGTYSGILSNRGSVNIEGGTILINNTISAGRGNMSGINAPEGRVLVEGDSVLDIQLSGSSEGYGSYGINADKIHFGGNSAVVINVSTTGGSAYGFTTKKNEVKLTTTNVLTVRERHFGKNYEPENFLYDPQYYTEDELILGGRPFHSYMFKTGLYSPEIQTIEVARRPNAPIVYYNQTLDLTGLEVELTDQYGNKTLVPLERFEEKGITTDVRHGEIFPNYHVDWLVITHSNGAYKSMPISTAYASVSVQKVELDKTFIQVQLGNTKKLTETITPSNATNKNVTWSSNNPSVATVDNNGNVKGISVGQATITVRTADGNKTEKCVVYVEYPDVRVNGVVLNEESIELYAGESRTLTAFVTPNNAGLKDLEWSTDNASVASVNEKGRVTAIAPGTAVITVTTLDGGLTDSCSVKVKGDGVSVSGEIDSYDPKKEIKVQLKQGNEVKYEHIISGEASGKGKQKSNFTIEGVEEGTYDLVVTKNAHLAYTVKNVVVEGQDIDLTEATGKPYKLITMLVGDVNGDGNINESDVSIIRYTTNINKPTHSVTHPSADVDGDGNVNESDVSIVRYTTHINKSTLHCTYDY